MENALKYLKENREGWSTFFHKDVLEELAKTMQSYVDQELELKLSEHKKADDLDSVVFRISRQTPFLYEEVKDFIFLTNSRPKDAEILLKKLSEEGASSLIGVNFLAKLGLLSIPEYAG